MTPSEDRNFLVRLRKTLGVRQAYLSQKTGIYRTKLSNWERGKAELTAEELARVSTVLDETVIEMSEAQKIESWSTKFPAPRTSIEKGANLRNWRLKSGISQTALAEKAGIARPVLSLFENGYVDLEEDVVTRMEGALADIAKVKIDALKASGSHLQDILSGSLEAKPVISPETQLQVSAKGVQLSSLLKNMTAAPAPISLGDQGSMGANELTKLLEYQIKILTEIVEIQDALITKGIDGAALVAEAAKKDVEIAALKQRVKDVMEMYEIGSEAVAANARFEELREKVQKPVLADEEESE